MGYSVRPIIAGVRYMSQTSRTTGEDCIAAIFEDGSSKRDVPESDRSMVARLVFRLSFRWLQSLQWYLINTDPRPIALIYEKEDRMQMHRTEHRRFPGRAGCEKCGL